MIPLHVQLLLHAYAIAEPIDDSNGTRREYLGYLERLGLIEVDPDRRSSGWKTTERGTAHIRQILDLPLPTLVQRWVDGNGRPINME